MYKTEDQIVEWCKTNLKRPLTKISVYYHKNNPSNQIILRKLRDEYNAQITQVEWSSKRRRLEELGKIYEHCVNTKKFPIAINALKQMQEEVEGKKGAPGTVNLIQNNYHSMTDEEIDKKRLELIELVQKHKVIEAHAIEQNPSENEGAENIDV